jgi:hypothetical protein
MIGPNSIIAEPTARLANRAAMASVLLVLLTLFLHRLLSFPTAIALNMFVVAFCGAGLAIVLAIAAFLRIWFKGRSGAWKAASGLVFGSLVLLWPLAQFSTARSLPQINDITTDWGAPPRFTQATRSRGDGANRVAYPGDSFARLQAQAYPDIRPLVVDRSVEEVYEVVLTLVRGRRGLGWKVSLEEPPTIRPAKPGVIEATERTLILGFTDDIAIRISGDDKSSRIDIRSASRFGRHDLGANASRIRRFSRELQTRLESVSPFGVAGRGGARGTRAMQSTQGAAAGVAKRPLERLRDRVDRESAPNSAQPDARRGPQQKERPRG